MRQSLTLLFFLLFSLKSLSAADASSDFYLGWVGIKQNFKTNTQYTKYQQGVDLGAHLYIDASDELLIGGEAGFSHIETNWDISGNITHLQFLLKYRATPFFEIFGGLGVASRGTPSGTSNPVALFGPSANGGIAFFTFDQTWRCEAVLNYYNFSGVIDGSQEEITSLGAAIHLGRSIELY